MRLRLAALAGAACLTSLAAPTSPATASAPYAWLTPELAARADAAGAAGTPLPAAALADLSSGTLAFTGIRPGVMVAAIDVGSREVGSPCTANFVFQDTAGPFDPTQDLYLGTAAHCVDLGDTVRAVAVAPGAGTPVLVTLGPVVVDADTEDFALIALNPAVNAWVSPSVAYWGGPTGAYTGPAGGLATLTGHGGGAGGFVPRLGTLQSYGSAVFTVQMPIVGGDSGGPVQTFDGLAVGLQSDLPGNHSGVAAGILGRGPVISVMQSLAGKALSTCPTSTPWPLAGCPTL